MENTLYYGDNLNQEKLNVLQSVVINGARIY
jgi:hypothetical protein